MSIIWKINKENENNGLIETKSRKLERNFKI